MEQLYQETFYSYSKSCFCRILNERGKCLSRVVPGLKKKDTKLYIEQNLKISNTNTYRYIIYTYHKSKND